LIVELAENPGSDIADLKAAAVSGDGVAVGVGVGLGVAVAAAIVADGATLPVDGAGGGLDPQAATTNIAPIAMSAGLNIVCSSRTPEPDVGGRSDTTSTLGLCPDDA
jgi:hypothetical protein